MAIGLDSWRYGVGSPSKSKVTELEGTQIKVGVEFFSDRDLSNGVSALGCSVAEIECVRQSRSSSNPMLSAIAARCSGGIGIFEGCSLLLRGVSLQKARVVVGDGEVINCRF